VPDKLVDTEKQTTLAYFHYFLPPALSQPRTWDRSSLQYYPRYATAGRTSGKFVLSYPHRLSFPFLLTDFITNIRDGYTHLRQFTIPLNQS
jgi:hypothetical protein